MQRILNNRGWWTVLLAMAVAVSAHATTKSHKPAAKKHAPVKTTSKLGAHPAGVRRHRARSTPFRYRLAHLQMSSGRVQEIQSALAKGGYYQGETTGRWDESTKAAMRQYQGANGFSPTGNPDAKSLMKLGLGPHPLPLELDSTAQSRVNLETAPKTDPATGAVPNDKARQPNNLNQP